MKFENIESPRSTMGGIGTISLARIRFFRSRETQHTPAAAVEK